MPSILESIIGADRFAAVMRGENVQMEPDEVVRFQLACDDSQKAAICTTPCLFKNKE